MTKTAHSDLVEYMKANAPANPFKVREAVSALIRESEKLPRDRQVDEAIESLCATHRSLSQGILDLHVEHEWASAFRAKRWWERRAFKAGRDEWVAERFACLQAEAEMDVRAILTSRSALAAVVDA